MIADQEIQADIISKLKSIVLVTSLLPEGQSGIKELQWQGDEFRYPGVRLDLEDNSYEFDEQERCELQVTEFSVYVFSEEKSSKQCSTVKGLLATALVGLGFTGTYAKYTRLRLVDNIPAIRQDERTWRSQLRFRTFVQNI